MMQNDPATIAKGLSKAQREALLAGQHCPANGVWHPAGVYVSAEKRVRYNLVRLRLIRDYARRSNRLSVLGLAVRTYLETSHAE